MKFVYESVWFSIIFVSGITKYYFNFEIILKILHFQTVGVGIGINASRHFNTSDRELLRGKHFVIGTIEVKPFSYIMILFLINWIWCAFARV